MNRFRKATSLTLALLGTGLLKLPLERAFTVDLRDRGVIPEPLSMEMWNQLGQNGLAGTLGGLRSVVAVSVSLKAHGHFADLEWYELEKDYNLITSLTPKNPFYWINGSWHLSYNAAAWARNNTDLRPIQRRTMEREYLEKGDAFLRRGLEQMPDNIDLWAEIGHLWSSPFKRPDYARAAEAWEQAAKLGNNQIYKRRYLYTLSQVRGREYEALEYARELAQEYPRNLRLPTFRTLFWVLHQLPGLPPKIQRPTLEQVFGSRQTAYLDLYNYRFRTEEENFVKSGVDSQLRELVDELQPPSAINPFLAPTRHRLTRERWNQYMNR